MSRQSMPASAAALYERLMDEPLAMEAELRAAVETCCQGFDEAVGSNDFVDPEDVARARKLSLALLEISEQSDDEEQRRAIQAAVQYFILEDDGDDDRGIGGLDDDLMVLQRVAESVGLDVQGTA